MYKDLIQAQLDKFKLKIDWINEVKYSDYLEREITQFKGNYLTAGLGSEIIFGVGELGVKTINFDAQYVLVYDRKFQEQNVFKSISAYLTAGAEIRVYNPNTREIYESIFEEELKSDSFKMALFIVNHTEIIESYKNCDIEPC